MSIFGNIMDRIFAKKDAEIGAMLQQGTTSDPNPATRAQAPAAAAPAQAPMSDVDVEAVLDGLAKKNAQKLNWKTSIVDLMKLLGIDSDYESRKALAQELGRSDYSGSAEDNVWLHRQVMKGLHDNGGKVPAQFVD